MVVNLAPDYLVESGQVHPSWLPVLEDSREELAALGVFLSSLITAGTQILPEPDKILLALTLPVDQVKVVIIGQDPYPTPGHAMGLAFSVSSDVRPLPRSLSNIFDELQTDIGCESPLNGDLSGWAKQGVLLLNRVMTVSAGNVGSHRGKGWETITSNVIRFLASKNCSVVAILWGKDAQRFHASFDPDRVIASVHPSPLSAQNGFVGSKPFSRANRLLSITTQRPIEWCLGSPAREKFAETSEQ
jgi:uracil-DNA glycosylase